MADRASPPSLPLRLGMRVEPGSQADFELWRWAVSPMFEFDALERSDRASFELSSDGYFLGDIAISATQSSATQFERNGATIAKSGIDTILLHVYMSGSYGLDADGHEAVIEAGDVTFLDLTRPSRMAARRLDCLSITMSRHLLSPLVKDLDAIHGRRLQHGTPLNALLLSHMQTLQAQAGRLLHERRASIAQATASLVAACLEPSSRLREDSGQAIGRASLQMIRRTIDLELADPALDPEFLAKRFKMSRAALYRLFQPLGGVRHYIQQRRLMRACQAIADPAHIHERISTIAERWGFTNKTVFSRAFRELYDASPTDVRIHALRRASSAPASQESTQGSFWAVNRWLSGLEAVCE